MADLLAARELPLKFAGASVDDVLALVERDKKRSGGRVPFVLVDAPGEVTPGHEVDAGHAAGGRRGGARGVNDQIAVLHGVNFDVLGRRPAAHYGGLTLSQLEVQIKRYADELGLDRDVLPEQPRGRLLRGAAQHDRAPG